MDKSVGVCRWLLMLGLVAFGVIIGVVLFPLTAESSPVQAQACTAPAYEKGKVYQQGDQVQHKDQQFECWKDEDGPPLGTGSWAWCQVPAYEPLLQGGPWKDAWKELGECGGFAGNRLTLSFATLSGKAPLKPAVPGVVRADEVLTGVLRCKAEEIPISAKASDTLHLDNLKACDYQLVMNVADGFVPLNTPRIISFKQVEGDEQAVTVRDAPRRVLQRQHRAGCGASEKVVQGNIQGRSVKRWRGIRLGVDRDSKQSRSGNRHLLLRATRIGRVI